MTGENSNVLMTADEGAVVDIINANGDAALVLVCEHASSYIPFSLGDLGLSEDARYSHIAWDIGAYDLATALSRMLDAPLVASRVSRLVYDCNRPLADSSATPTVSERYDVPGNCSLSTQQRQQRYDEVYLPFERMLAQQVATQSDKLSADTHISKSPCFETRLETNLEPRIETRPVANSAASSWQLPVLVTVHSFTPIYHGQTRDVEIGLLHDEESQFAIRMQEAVADLEIEAGQQQGNSQAPFPALLKVELNKPYSASDGVMHTLVTHARPSNLSHVMIEVNNKLLRDADGVREVAKQLASMINLALLSGPA